MEAKTYTHPESAKGPTFVQTVNGTKLVNPGETVIVSFGAATLPADTAPALSKIEALQKLSILRIEAEFGGLSNDELTELLKLERASPTPRPTLTGKIEAEQLKRSLANANSGNPQPSKIEALQKLTIAQIEPSLATLSNDELQDLLTLEAKDQDPRSTLISAIEAEQLKRIESAQNGGNQRNA